MWGELGWVFLFLLILVPALYNSSKTFRYFTKLVIYYGYIMVLGVFVCFVAAFRPGDVDNCRIAANIYRPLKHILGIVIEVRGKENLESDKPYIIVCNHQSSLDMLGMIEIWPKHCTSLVKKELKYAGIFGLASWLCGIVFIDRLNHGRAKETLLSVAKLIKDRNMKLFIFPEGTRNKGGDMLPFKKGAFNLAVESQVPIIPMVFSSYYPFFNSKERRLETGKFTISCLSPIPTTGLTFEDVPDLAEKIREQMMDEFNQISGNCAGVGNKPPVGTTEKF